MLLFSAALCIVVGFTGFCFFTHSTPSQAWDMLTMGMKYVGARVNHTPPFHGMKQVNILVFGTDVSFDTSGTARTDTIKLVSVDTENPRISILSIPRDTWVAIPGHGHGRINGAYQYGGADVNDRINMTKTTVSNVLSELTGQEIPIHYYVRMQTDKFVDIVDTLGGVEVDVEKKMDYEDPSQNLFIHLTPGKQLLDGNQCMGYVRFRHDAEGDYGRIRRQDQFVRAMVAKLTQPEEKKRLPALLGPIKKMVRTDLELNDLQALRGVLSQVGMAGIFTAQLPTVPARKGRASVVEIDDPVLAAQTVKEVLNGPRPTVAVLNASGRSGLARDVAEQIDTNTFNVLACGTVAEPVAVSKVIAVERCKGEAARLALALGVATVDTKETPPPADFGKQTPPPSEITVVLGNDYTPVPKVTSEQAELP